MEPKYMKHKKLGALVDSVQVLILGTLFLFLGGLWISSAP